MKDYQKRLYSSMLEQLECPDDGKPGLLRDIAARGAGIGWKGFYHFSDYLSFYERNQKDIVHFIEDVSKEYASEPVPFVASFLCFRGKKFAKKAFTRAMYSLYYADNENGDDVDQIVKVLVIYALEEMARRTINEL